MVLKQYEKYATFLRSEVTSNNLRDYGLVHIAAAREKFLEVVDRFAVQQAENLTCRLRIAD